jgi:hypothetical protein
MFIQINIPKRATITNGDVIKAMFPNAEIDIGERLVLFDVGVWIATFPLYWWNEPYTRKEKE